MAYSSTSRDRAEDARLRALSNSSDESPFAFYRPTITAESKRSSNSALGDTRAYLQRRFTTQSLSTISGLSAMGQQRRQATEPSVIDNPFAMVKKAQLLEKKQAEYDFLRQKHLQFQHEMDLIARQVKREEEEVQRLRHDLGNLHAGAGHQSEPTTPPEYREVGFPSVLSRPNRFSSSGVMSPPGIINRPSRAGSQVTSPPVERAKAYHALTAGPPSQSVPGSLQDSEDDEDQYEPAALAFNYRSAPRNRNSMPVTRRDLGVRSGIADFDGILGPVDTSRYLFGDEYKSPSIESKPASRPVSSYLSMQQNGDNFPVLIRSDGDTRQSQNSVSDALDSALPDMQERGVDAGGWPTSFSRPTTSNGSLSIGQSGESVHLTGDSPPHALSHVSSPGQITPPTLSASNRHSMGAKMSFTETKRPNAIAGGYNTSSRLPSKLQTSFSTSSVPTVSSLNSTNPMSAGAAAPALPTAEQRFHHHNASLGRIPASAMNGARSNHEPSPSSADAKTEAINNSTASPLVFSALHASAAPFGPMSSVLNNNNNNSVAGVMSANNYSSLYSSQTYGLGYPVQPSFQHLNSAMNSITLAQPAHGQWSGQMQSYTPEYNGYGSSYQYSSARFPENQLRGMQQRRNQGAEEPSKFANVAIESLQGELYSLCKDQHGCRYLQKKLEERNPSHIQMIFQETNEHVVELMTDPFGNYLCQKLLEFTNEEQRTVLIKNAASHMVDIALNQHGTRALQKMIEYVSTPEQIQMVIFALKDQVVAMIQDLNGNHVVQKCLNHLTNIDAQFIFDAVSIHCVTVGTHRHGCCVIQRCIDHASGKQKAQLVDAITYCALPLVQDPFGNYVLQYIFDQGEERFSTPLCRALLGKLPMLARQKFSSNVVEKCLRIADTETKHLMIRELLHAQDFDRLVDDPFANYVMQTAWDYALPADEALLAEKIRPIMPRMRNKPYGRRYQNRLAERDRKFGVAPLETFSPSELSLSPDSGSYVSNSTAYHAHTLSQESLGVRTPNTAVSGIGSPIYGSLTGNNGFSAPHGHRFSNPPPAQLGQFLGNGQPLDQFGQQYGRMNQQHGMNFF